MTTAPGTAAGVRYSYTHIAQRTFSTEIGRLKKACMRALEKMNIEAADPIPTDEGFRIVAITRKLRIRIDLERITERLTRLTVNAKAGFFKKDVAIATEIIRKTEAALEKGAQRAQVRPGG